MTCKGFCKGMAVGLLVGAGAVMLVPEKRTRCMKRQARRTVRDMEKAMEQAMDALGGMLA